MDIEIDRDRIITKFKRNGLYLTKNSLEMVMDFLNGINNPSKKLDQVLTKLNEMVIMDEQQFNDKTLKLTLQLLSHKTQTGKSFTSYQKFMQNMRRWTILYLSPYQSAQRFFISKPSPQLFQFDASTYTEINIRRYKQIKQHNTISLKSTTANLQTFIGVIYQHYSISGNKIMLQNQLTQVQLLIPASLEIDCFLIPGCTYIAKGQFKTRDMQLTVTEIQLPKSLPLKKQTLCQNKLKVICDNILMSKNKLDFTVEEFRVYEVIYNREENKARPVLIFGNVYINKVEIQRIKGISQKYKSMPECIILMIAEDGHEGMDLKKQFPHFPVYIVPHLNSEGPRILPKIPVLRNDYNVRITSNPARFSIHGKECMFLNYPLVKNLYSQSLVAKQLTNVDQAEMIRKVSRTLFSQNNVAICNKIYWNQSQYFNIYSDDLLFICDKSCAQNLYAENQNKFISVGNFQRDGDFVSYMPEIKNPIQLCAELQ